VSIRADLDLKNGIDGKESRLLSGNSVCVGAFPPSSTADAGMESIIQFILLGPLQQAINRTVKHSVFMYGRLVFLNCIDHLKIMLIKGCEMVQLLYTPSVLWL
jgi:hypothetical protein